MESEAKRIFGLGQERFTELWRDADGNGYASFEEGGVSRHAEIRSDELQRQLSLWFWDNEKEVPKKRSLDDAMGLLEAVAVDRGETYPVPKGRIAHHEKRVYIDRGTRDRSCIVISANSDQPWKEVPAGEVPVRFVRNSQMLPMPSPRTGGSLRLFTSVFQLAEEASVLVLGFLLGQFSPSLAGGKPILNIVGSQGSGKTVLAQGISRVISPFDPAVSSLQTKEDDFVTAGQRRDLVTFDNVSSLSSAECDMLCRASTGASVVKRKLYTNSGVAAASAHWSSVLTSIPVLGIGRQDYLERTIVLPVEPIRNGTHRTMFEINAQLESRLPFILDALYAAVATGLQNFPVALEWTPRNADFARWVESCAPAFGYERGVFTDIYRETQAHINEQSLDVSALGQAVLTFVRPHSEWRGLISELHGHLILAASDAQRSSSSWPRDAARLGAALRRIAPLLYQAGVDVQFTPRSRAGSVVVVKKLPNFGESQREDGFYEEVA